MDVTQMIVLKFFAAAICEKFIQNFSKSEFHLFIILTLHKSEVLTIEKVKLKIVVFFM